MTKIQQKFYDMITNQIVDFNAIFHKEFIQKRIQQIPEDQLRNLQENILTNKDKIGKKGYIDYNKFVYYADKLIEKNFEQDLKLPNITSKVDELYNKRALLINTIQNQTKSLQERNELIENLKNRVVMFKDNGKNILDEIDYFIIEQFGFYNFFDENKNYMIKEEIENYLKLYTTNQMLLKESDTKKLINN